jgi:hypothetical protein
MTPALKATILEKLESKISRLVLNKLNIPPWQELQITLSNFVALIMTLELIIIIIEDEIYLSLVEPSILKLFSEFVEVKLSYTLL